jgi:hypothetical protein
MQGGSEQLLTVRLSLTANPELMFQASVVPSIGPFS